MTRIRRIILFLAVCLALALPVDRLMAHAELRSAVPAPGENLTRQPREVRLIFSEAVGPGSTITLFGEGFRAVEGLTAAMVDPEKEAVLVSAVPYLEPGTYSVNWVVISLDGHPASGSYTFGVLPEGAAAFPVVGVIGGVGTAVIILGAGAWLYGRKRTKSS